MKFKVGDIIKRTKDIVPNAITKHNVKYTVSDVDNGAIQLEEHGDQWFWDSNFYLYIPHDKKKTEEQMFLFLMKKFNMDIMQIDDVSIIDPEAVEDNATVAYEFQGVSFNFDGTGSFVGSNEIFVDSYKTRNIKLSK